MTFIPSPYSAGFPGCFVADFSGILWVAYLLAAIYELGIMLFTCFKVFDRKRRHESLLMRTVTWDGFVFYSFMFGISAVSLAILLAAPLELKASLTSIHRAIHAVLSGRLIIRLRKVATRSQYPSKQGVFISSTERSRGMNSVHEVLELVPIQEIS